MAEAGLHDRHGFPVVDEVQDDPFLAVRYTVELLLALDRAAEILAQRRA